jgi:hypothetical protein
MTLFCVVVSNMAPIPHVRGRALPYCTVVVLESFEVYSGALTVNNIWIIVRGDHIFTVSHRVCLTA